MTARYYGTRGMLPRERLWTGAAAEAEIMWSLGGRARWLTEATYGVPVTGNPPVGPLPPHADGPGHDHSGGYQGAPIVRSFWCVTFGMPDDVLGGNITEGRAPQCEIDTLTVAGFRRHLFKGSLKHKWVPGTGGADEDCLVHKRCTLLIGVYLYTSTGTKHDLLWTIRSADNFRKSGSWNMDANAESHITLELDDAVALTPGYLNEIEVELWVEGPTAAGTARPSLLYISGNQTEVDA